MHVTNYNTKQMKKKIFIRMAQRTADALRRDFVSETDLEMFYRGKISSDRCG